MKTKPQFNFFSKFTFLLLFLLTLNFGFGQTATAPAGAGTSANPYQIASLENLYWITQNSTNWVAGKHFLQTDDIDATSTASWSGGWPGIGSATSSSSVFRGIYDGNGNKIENLTIDITSSSSSIVYHGLFNMVAGNAEIKNLKLINPNHKLEVTGTALGGYIGGIMGGADSSNSVNLENIAVIGGKIELIIDGPTSGSNFHAGGITGVLGSSSKLTKSYASGVDVILENKTGTNTYNNVGGLAGMFRDNARIEDCYSKASVSATIQSTIQAGIGGIAGRVFNNAKIYNSYTASSLTALSGSNANASNVMGAVFGWYEISSDFEFSNIYYNSNLYSTCIGTNQNTTTLTCNSGSTADMNQQNHFSGYDFVNIWGIDPNINDGYPYLQQNLPDCNDFLAEQPTLDNGVYQIANFKHLRWISENSSSWDADFIQTGDIDAVITTDNCYNSGEGWSPIGTTATKFTGSYNGDGYTISNLFIDRPTTDRIGLFGETDGATIIKVGLIDPNISGGHLVGGLIGISTGGGTVSECFVRGGSITGNNNGSTDGFIGGLIGRDFGGATISDVYTNTTVSNAVNTAPAAGLIGQYDGSTINRAYVAGSVHPNAVSPGDPPATVNRRVIGQQQSGASCNDCYFDATINSDVIPGQGTGKTTTEMQLQATFTNWDFQCELANGTDDIWGIDEGNDYPRLSWEGFVQTFPYVVAPVIGDGLSMATAYQINTLENLSWIAEDESRWDKFYIQTANIDAAATQTNQACFGTGGWVPIGNTSTQFTGNYDGGGFEIQNLFIDRTSLTGVGLFGWIVNADIRNLHVSNSEVRGLSRTAVIIGRADGSDLTRLSASGTAFGSSTGYSQVGGIVGYLLGSSVAESFSNVTINSNGGSLGSLVGYCTFLSGGNGSSITNSYATGDVTSINNKDFVGGLTGGLANSSVTNSYSTGVVTSTATSNVGGLVGGDNGTLGASSVSNSFYDTTTSGLNVSAIGGTSKTTTEMQQQATFTNWDFQCESANGTDDIWGIHEGNDYPRLSWEGYTQDCTVQWTGTVSSDWSISGNWSNQLVPNTLSIPEITNVANQPISTSSIEVASLTLNAGSSLTINPTHALKVYGTMTNNGQILFKSDATGSGQFDEFAGTISGSGNVVIERYIPARRAFRFLSSAITSSGSINANWQEGATSNTDNPNAGFGTHITGSTTGANGFDATPSGNPSLFTLNNATQSWESVSNTDVNNITAGTPYRILVRGNRSIDVTSNSAVPTPTTIRTTGATTALNTGTISINGLSQVAEEYNFIGNPYPAAVDMNQVLSAATNMNQVTYWVWDPTLGGTPTPGQLGGRGAYVAVNVNENTSNNGNANRYLQPGQAAFVQTAANGATTMSFEEVHKAVSQPQTQVFNVVSTIRMKLYDAFSFANGGTSSDGLLLKFSEEGSNQVTFEDAMKFYNQDENLASVNGETLLSIESRALPEVGETIPLFTNQYRKTNYMFEVRLNEVNDITALLVDNFTGTTTQLENNENTLYAFQVDATIPASIANDRFEIVFEELLNTAAVSFGNGFVVFPNPAQGEINIATRGIAGQEVQLNISSILGQNVYNNAHTVNSNGLISIDSAALAKGIYILQLTGANGGQFTAKIIKK